MIKKAYQKPTINVVKLQHQTHILAGSGPDTLQGHGQERRGNREHLVRPGVINILTPNIIRGRSTFVCFVPEFFC